MASNAPEVAVSDEQAAHFLIFRTEDLRTAFDNLTDNRFSKEVEVETVKNAAGSPRGYLHGNLPGFEDWANYC